MMTRKHFLAGAAGVAATVAVAGAASAQVPQHWSNRNMLRVRAGLEGLLDQLAHDDHDYGGYRVRAIADMQRARENIIAALRWYETHPH
jgi:hypothetical protein